MSPSASPLRFSALLWLLPLLASFLYSDERDGRPNVVFLLIDDLNDYAPAHEFPGVKTPHLDRFADTALVLENSHCSAPICVPSRTSLYSGTLPWTTGSYYNQPSTWEHPQMEGILSLPETFQYSGYITFGAGKLFHQGPSKERMDAMWDYASHMNGGFGPFKPNPDGSPGRDFQEWHVWTGPDSDFPDVRNTDAAIDFLQKEHDAPFFLNLGIYRPHTPLTAPKRFFDLYEADSLPLPPGFKDDDLDDLPPYGVEVAIGRKQLTPSSDLEYKQQLHAYLACISFMDWNVGRVLTALEKSPYADNTIIVFASDHGFHQGEKHHHAKSTLWDQGTQSSMMIRVPGVTSATKTRTPVSLVDLYPTFIELCSLTPPPHSLDGRSIKPILQSPDQAWPHPALTMHGPGNLAVRTEHFRYIRYEDGSEELYDHRVDPYEITNLANEPEYAAIKTELATHYPNYPQKWATPIQNKGYRLW